LRGRERKEGAHTPWALLELQVGEGVARGAPFEILEALV